MYDFQKHIAPLFLELRRVAGEGLMQAAIALGIDHANRTAKPWTYYLGIATGGVAVATGIPNASLILYTTAAALDLLVFKSPEGGPFDAFVDGIAVGSFSTYSTNMLWEVIRVNLGQSGNTSTVEFRTRGTNEEDEPIDVNWFSVASIMPVNGVIIERAKFSEAAAWQITIKARDAANRSKTISLCYPYYATHEQVEAYVVELITRLRSVLALKFENVSISRPISVGDASEPLSRQVGSMSFTLNTYSATKFTLSLPAWREDFTIISRTANKRYPSFSPQVDDVRNMLIIAPSLGFVSNPCNARGEIVSHVAKVAWKV